jgi:hypothetical protein
MWQGHMHSYPVATVEVGGPVVMVVVLDALVDYLLNVNKC